MKDTWNYDLMEILDQARLGEPEALNEYLQKYSPFAVVNENYTVLLTLRHFHVSFWEGERSVLNCHPEKEHFQWGITITTAGDDSGSEANVYLPNSRNYTGVKIRGQEIDVLTENEVTKTNVTELFRKLDFWDDATEENIDTGFSALCNERYEDEEAEKPEVENTVITLPSTGELIYNEKYNWYEGQVRSGDASFEISVHHTTSEELKKLFEFSEKQIQSEFYKKMLLAMEDEMIALKNDLWLGEDEDTGEEERPVTAEEFRERVAINSIVFYEDGSSVIYCNDDDIFWGHMIAINVDRDGNYKDAGLAG